MSLTPTAMLETTLGLYVVIDEGEGYDDVLIIPTSFGHRRVVARADLEAMGTLHPATTDSPQDVADELAAGVRSFLSSLSFMAPEMVELQAQVKLAQPLAGYEAAKESDPTAAPASMGGPSRVEGDSP